MTIMTFPDNRNCKLIENIVFDIIKMVGADNGTVNMIAPFIKIAFENLKEKEASIIVDLIKERIRETQENTYPAKEWVPKKKLTTTKGAFD